MKTALFLTVIFSGSLMAAPLHLDLEMESSEYQALLKKMEKNNSSNKSMKADDPSIANAIKIGERLSKWIAKVNDRRTPETAIRLTSPTTRRGIPIDKPNQYSPSIIKRDLESALNELPKEMKEVLTGAGELPDTISIPDEQFITLARKVDRQYQSAARYKSVDQYRFAYIQAAAKDVRGYYYFKTNKIIDADLRDVGSIAPEKVTAIKNALALICLNTKRDMNRCKTEVTTAFSKNKAAEMYLQYFPNAQKNWNTFYDIPAPNARRDISWSGSTATVPFNTPEIPKFIPYLKNNIEDEWKWNGWQLRLNFGSFSDGPYLKFETGVVPHVNDLGGNEIVMDSNQPIEEYESQWTIRHEFGHVLGFPDCYHEFYDTSAQAYVNYQLDITDLMCSRAGNMNERLYQGMKQTYGKR